MNQRPLAGAIISDFRGMISNADPRDLSDQVAQLQVNFTHQKSGELTTRGGLRPVTFEEPAE